MVVCPSCNGVGGGYGFACGPKGGGVRYLACTACKGAKEITEEHAARCAQGERMRRERLGRNITLRAEASRLGVDIGEWSRIEHGQEPETKAGAAALETRLKEIGVAEQAAP